MLKNILEFAGFDMLRNIPKISRLEQLSHPNSLNSYIADCIHACFIIIKVGECSIRVSLFMMLYRFQWLFPFSYLLAMLDQK